MTIGPGGEWGRRVATPADLVIVDSDAALVDAVDEGRRVGVGGGDLARTLGNPVFSQRAEARELPVDLIEVTVDGRSVRRGIAHLVAHRPRRRGGAWRGPVLAVMNAEFIGPYDVAARGHPNDGRVETLLVASTMTMRARATARARSRTAGHLPHPEIETRSVRQATWEFDEDLIVHVDGTVVGKGRRIEVQVLPDAATVYA